MSSFYLIFRNSFPPSSIRFLSSDLKHTYSISFSHIRSWHCFDNNSSLILQTIDSSFSLRGHHLHHLEQLLSSHSLHPISIQLCEEIHTHSGSFFVSTIQILDDPSEKNFNQYFNPSP